MISVSSGGGIRSEHITMAAAFSLKGYHTVAGGRSVAQTTGKRP